MIYRILGKMMDELTTFSDARAQIIPWIQSLDVSDRTRETYQREIVYYLDWLESTGHTGGDRSDIIDYKSDLMDRYTASTVSAYLSAVRGYYRYLESSKQYPDITRSVKGAKKPKGFRKDPLSPEQVRSLLSSVDTKTPDGLRNYALLNLMIRTGLRTIEVSRADVGDIRQIGGCTVLFIQGKGREEKDDYVILTPSALSPLRDYLRNRDAKDTEPLFTSLSNRDMGDRMTTRSISRIVKDCLRAAGIDSDRITAHSMRHTAVTLALMGGATIQQAQAMARHSKIETTLIYAHNLDRMNSSAEDCIDRVIA